MTPTTPAVAGRPTVGSLYTCRRCGWSGAITGRRRCRACHARHSAEWRKRNPEKARAQKRLYDRRFRAERPDEYRARHRRYYVPETDAKVWARRLAWMREGDVTREQLVAIYERDGGSCVYCGTAVRARFSPHCPCGFDHVVSRVNGGRHTAENLVVACGPCNVRKG